MNDTQIPLDGVTLHTCPDGTSCLTYSTDEDVTGRCVGLDIDSTLPRDLLWLLTGIEPTEGM